MVTYYGRTSIFTQFGFFLLLQIDNCYYMYKLLICSFKLLIWINKLITNLK